MTPIQFDTGVKKILLVEVPKHQKYFGLLDSPYGQFIVFHIEGTYHRIHKRLPDGNYHFIGIASEISEEVARTLVLWQDKSNPNAGFEHYMTDEDCQQNDLVEAKNTARQSILSLCAAHNLPPDTTVLLQKIMQ